MAEVVVIGAGLSGTLMAYELLPQLRKDDRLTVVSRGPVYHFVPSNPWAAIGWRKRTDIEGQRSSSNNSQTIGTCHEYR